MRHCEVQGKYSSLRLSKMPASSLSPCFNSCQLLHVEWLILVLHWTVVKHSLEGQPNLDHHSPRGYLQSLPHSVIWSDGTVIEHILHIVILHCASLGRYLINVYPLNKYTSKQPLIMPWRCKQEGQRSSVESNHIGLKAFFAITLVNNIRMTDLYFPSKFPWC